VALAQRGGHGVDGFVGIALGEEIGGWGLVVLDRRIVGTTVEIRGHAGFRAEEESNLHRSSIRLLLSSTKVPSVVIIVV